MNGARVRPDPMMLAGVACVSAAILGFEISLMRVLLIASWHHFAFLVISVALLGLGTSGTALCLLRPRLGSRKQWHLGLLAAATAVSMPLCMSIAQHVAIEARLVPAILGQQLTRWLVYWTCLAAPFLLGGATVGLALMYASGSVPRVYAANLGGSAAGGLLATAAMYLMSAEWLPVAMAAPALLGAALLHDGKPRGRIAIAGVTAALIVACVWVTPPCVRPDPGKYANYLRDLESQGAATLVASAVSPRSAIEIYAGDVFHDLPFLAAGAAPPPMLAVAMDGHHVGSVLRVKNADEAAVMDRTLMAMPYALAPANPRVLLLGETGGRNVWLARRRAARSIVVVQADHRLLQLVGGPVAHLSGGVLELPGVRTVTAETRHFVERSTDRFDLIQLAGWESSSAGSGGVGGLMQDYLLTVEGVTRCLELLSADGLLVACRGMQTPPRDNLRIIATVAESLRRAGATTPQAHIVVVRDFLALCTIAKASPWTDRELGLLRSICAARDLTPVWFSGIKAEELNQPDEMPGPPGGHGDWYYHATRRIFSPEVEAFFEDWPFAVRPATDDRPFFLDFCKLGSLSELRRGFGEMWLTRCEMAFPLVLGATGVVAIVGTLLTLLPLAFFRMVPDFFQRRATVGYFAAIGLGYLLMEMGFLSRMTLLVGDPVQAAALTISTFLLASGLGSLTAQRLGTDVSTRLGLLFVVIAIVGALELAVLQRVAVAVGSMSFLARALLAVLLMAPLGYLMGFPFPSALSRLESSAPAMIPWAWGINGFASVLAAPSAMILSMTWGHRMTGVIGAALYLLAGALLYRIPGSPGARSARCVTASATPHESPNV